VLSLVQCYAVTIDTQASFNYRLGEGGVYQSVGKGAVVTACRSEVQTTQTNTKGKRKAMNSIRKSMTTLEGKAASTGRWRLLFALVLLAGFATLSISLSP
jgi:hypothetical protein